MAEFDFICVIAFLQKPGSLSADSSGIEMLFLRTWLISFLIILDNLF